MSDGSTIVGLKEPVVLAKQETGSTKFPWQDKPRSCNKPIWRYSANPVIPRDALPTSNSIFNTAVTEFNGEYIAIIRCDHDDFHRTLNVARSRNGIDWNVSESPIEFEASKPNIPPCSGPYDPRITRIEDRYFITWCNVYHGPTLGLGYTDDFETFHLLEPITTPYNRNGVLFPRKVNDKYILLSRPSGAGHNLYGPIFYSESPDLEHWGCHRFVASPLPGWQDCKIGAGPPPIETPEGWLLIYHGVKQSCSGLVYRAGAILLDLDEPHKVIGRAKRFLLGPDMIYEQAGDVPNVVFPCGSLLDHETGRLALYYGAADTCTCLAFTTIDEVLDFIKKNPTE